MLKKLLAVAILGVSCVVLPSAHAAHDSAKSVAAASTKSDKDIQTLKKRLLELYPSANISSIRHSPMDGLYELVAGKNVMYTDMKGKYFVFGSIFDMGIQHDLTADRRAELNTVDSKSLPLADAIQIVHGKGTHKLFVFSDPECPYCKRAEEAMVGVDDVTIYVYLMPIPQLHPSAAKLSENIWCADDKVQAWNDWMLKGVQPADKRCDNPIARNQALGASMGINGTPTFVREDGKVMSGAPTREQIPSYLSKE